MSIELPPTRPELNPDHQPYERKTTDYISPYDVRELSLQHIPAEEREMADQRLVRKVTSGAEKITPHDLQYVSKDVFRNVIHNFEPANKKTAQNPFVGGTFINHYHATHGKHAYGRDMGAEKQMDRKFDTGDSIFKTKDSMYKKIKKAQKTHGLKRGGIAKKKKAKKKKPRGWGIARYKGK